MDDFGDILYVLAMVAALIFSAFKKSKQAKRRPPMPEQNSPSPYNPMDEEEPVMDELRDLFMPKTPKVEPAPKVSKPVQQAPAKPASNAIHHYKQTERLEVEDLDDEGQGFEFDTEDFDLRKAVIYSEILNRPHQ